MKRYGGLLVETSIKLPHDLVEQIKQVAGYRGRSKFLRQAARRELERILKAEEVVENQKPHTA